MTRDTPRQDGAAIRRMRRERGLRRSELARRVDITGPTLTTYENGNRQAGWEVLHRLAGTDALDVPVRDLLTDHGCAELAEVTP